MSDLEKDLKDFRSEDGGMLRSQHAKKIAAYITSLGYTRTGRTDVRREVVGRFRIEPDDAGYAHCHDGESWMVVRPNGIALSKSWHDKEEAEWTVEQLNGALSLGLSSSTPTPPEPPKPERKVVQVIYVDETINTNPGIYRLCDDGTLWWSNADGSDAKQINPIPGDAA